MKAFKLIGTLVLISIIAAVASAQTSTASISGTVYDEQQSVVPGATVTVRNTDTGFSRTTVTGGEGRFLFTNLPIGQYEVTVEAANFAKLVRSGVLLVANQDAVVDAALKAGGVTEIVTVTENASALNTSTPEIATRFDERRLSELPIATNRNVYNVLLSVPGVSQLGSGQTGFANGVNFSANGGRVRSNNFMIDGQDINDPSVAGGQIALNNPDAIQEVRIITNQFLPEYGRNAGSVVNFVSRSGTNDFHGSVFWFHNNEHLNSCSNLDKAAGFCNKLATVESRKRAPRRLENQIGFTVGGPVWLPWLGDGNDPYIWKGKDKTFFFVDYQRWSDRALGSGFTLNGAPTAEGRAVLQSVAAGRPQVQALLQFVPPGTPNGTSATFTIGSQTYTVPLGNVTGSSSFVFDDHQGSARIDHRFNDRNLFYARYRYDYQNTSGTGQVTPPGLTTVNKTKTKAATTVLNTILSSKWSNEARLAWSRFDSTTGAQDPSSETIPSIEISQLGMLGFNAAASRTAIGLAVNLPQFRINDTYQFTDSMTFATGGHTIKFGVDLRRTDVKSFFFPTVRGRLAYTTLNNFVNDIAQTATINLPLAGGDVIGFYRWWEYYAYVQDQWRVRPSLTLSFGVRYEYPGDSFSYLKELNKRILAANGNNAAFRFDPVPKVDNDNWMPRLGFNWNPSTSGKGVLGWITGRDKLVIRGGYARTFDANFININLNVFSSFPFVAAQNVSTVGAFTAMRNTTVPNVAEPNRLVRTVVSNDFGAPVYDQFSLELQRELNSDTVFKIGYVRTRGTRLFQTVDGNPCLPGRVCRVVGTNPNFGNRVNPNLETIRLRTNSGSSTYDALQASLDKRLSRGVSFGLHYTFSAFIDDGSEIFNPSTGEVAVAQDSFNRRADRARSSYDRPHRLTGNVVYEMPFYRQQQGVLGRLLGGWQVNSFFTFQSGAPFTVFLGSDPACAVCGIDGLVGNPIRPNLNTTLDLSRMSINEIRRAGGASLFRALDPGQRVGNAGRNILRADGIKLVDFGVIKNTRITENVRVQIRADMFNAFNLRNYGIPNSTITAGANFLNEGATNGGNRRVILGARLVF
ncbi:MAG: carboxypeptidase regulatory-like domain-containing protein [Pyrinomonadaceae bacterium]